MKTGIIAGTSLLHNNLFKGLRKRTVRTRYGTAVVGIGKGFVFIQRHGPKKDTLPHLINHRAHIGSLKRLGVDRIIGVCSSGSYRKSIKPGSIVVPDDFIDLCQSPTFFNKKMKDMTEAFTFPGFDNDLREQLIRIAETKGIRIVKKGTYFQVPGPRLETTAEVRMFSQFAEVVGMTMASEALLAKEAGVPYAGICSVDNYGRGINGKEVDFRSMEKVKTKSVKQIKEILAALL